MSSPAPTLVIAYGSWSTTSAGCYLHDVHEIDEDADRVAAEFSVVIQGSTETELLSRVATMTAELFKEHQRLTVTANGITSHDITGTLSDVSGSAPAAAQAVAATWDLLGEFRTSLSRAYRISVVASKPALQAGKTAKRQQRIELNTSPGGLRSLRVGIDFTVGADGSTAREMSEDATHGFNARVTAIKAALASGVVWEETGRSVDADADDRLVSVNASYRELPFAQSASDTDDTTLNSVSYSCRVVRRPGLAGGEFIGSRPLAELTVNFSALVKYSGTAVDPDAVIANTVLPYVLNTIAPRATVAGPRYVMGHTLRFSELPQPSVSGGVFFLIPEGTLLSGSASVRRFYTRGITDVPVLDGTEFTVDEHVGPGFKTAQIVVATEELGASNPELERVAERLTRELEAQGYKLRREARQLGSVRRSYVSPLEPAGQIFTSVASLTRELRYTVKRDPDAPARAPAALRSRVGPQRGAGA